MADLLLAGDEDRIRRKGAVITVYDPCCGSGGMLLIYEGPHPAAGARTAKSSGAVNPEAGVHLFGQEVNPETSRYASPTSS